MNRLCNLCESKFGGSHVRQGAYLLSTIGSVVPTHIAFATSEAVEVVAAANSAIWLGSAEASSVSSSK